MTRRIPTKGFRDAAYIAFPFPKLLGAVNAPPQITFIPISVQQGGITNNNRTIGRDAALEAEHEASMQIARMVPVIGSLIIIGDAGQAAGFHLIDQSRKIAGGEFQGAAKAQGVYGIALYYNLAKGSSPLLLLLPDRTGIPEALQNADPRAAERGGKVAEGVKSGGDLVAFFVPLSSAKIAGNAPGTIGELAGNYRLGYSGALQDVSAANRRIIEAFRAQGGTVILMRSTPRVNPTTGRPIFGVYRPQTNQIILYQGADLSTWSHELIHFMQIQRRGLVGTRVPEALRPLLEAEVNQVLRLWGFVPR